MSSNQLFRIIPDRNIIIELLNLFGIQDFNDKRYFTKQDMNDLKIIKNITLLIDKLNEYYLPCKSKIFLNNLNENRCITILRQFLKTHNYTIKTKKKLLKGKHFTIYSIDSINEKIIPITTNNKIIIKFE